VSETPNGKVPVPLTSRRPGESVAQRRARVVGAREKRQRLEEQILTLRDAGLSFRQIGQQLSISPGYAHQVYSRAIAMPAEHLSEFRIRQGRKLDRLLRPYLIRFADTRAAATTPELTGAALKIVMEQNRLKGAYPAAQVDVSGDLTVTHSVTVESVMAKLDALAAADEAASEERAVFEAIEQRRAALVASVTNGDGPVIDAESRENPAQGLDLGK